MTGAATRGRRSEAEVMAGYTRDVLDMSAQRYAALLSRLIETAPPADSVLRSCPRQSLSGVGTRAARRICRSRIRRRLRRLFAAAPTWMYRWPLLDDLAGGRPCPAGLEAEASRGDDGVSAHGPSAADR